MCFQHFASPTVWPCLGLTGQSDSSWTEFGEKGFQTRTDLLKTKYPPRTWSTVEYQPGFCCHLTGSASSSSWACRQTSPYRVIFCVCRQVHCNQSILLIALSGTEQNVVQFIMKPEHKYCLFRTIVSVLCTFPALGMKQNSWVWKPASNWSFSFPVPQLAVYWITPDGGTDDNVCKRIATWKQTVEAGPYFTAILLPTTKISWQQAMGSRLDLVGQSKPVPCLYRKLLLEWNRLCSHEFYVLAVDMKRGFDQV